MLRSNDWSDLSKKIVTRKLREEFQLDKDALKPHKERIYELIDQAVRRIQSEREAARDVTSPSDAGTSSEPGPSTAVRRCRRRRASAEDEDDGDPEMDAEQNNTGETDGDGGEGEGEGEDEEAISARATRKRQAARRKNARVAQQLLEAHDFLERGTTGRRLRPRNK